MRLPTTFYTYARVTADGYHFLQGETHYSTVDICYSADEARTAAQRCAPDLDFNPASVRIFKVELLPASAQPAQPSPRMWAAMR